MTNPTTNPKLQQFLTRLADGVYVSIARARSALGGTVGLTEDDKAEARRAMEAHFNPKKKIEDIPKIETVKGEPAKEAVATTLRQGVIKTKSELFLHFLELVKVAKEGPHSDEALTTLLELSLEPGASAAFVALFQHHSAQIVPSMLDLRVLGRHPEFFRLAEAIFTAPSPRSELVHDVVRMLISEIERRASDEEQVTAFEALVERLSKNSAPGTDLMALTSLVVTFASPRFAQHWLKDHDDNPEAVRGFARRMLTLYLNDETDASSLLALLETLHPERQIVEEVIRVLLSRRQLGDALFIVEHVPESFKPQLYQILYPVVVRHGDPLALVTFGAVFRSLVDKEEIKHLVKRFLKPDVDARLNDVLDGVDPVDIFESVPSMLPPSVAADLRNDLMRNLGMPVREARQAQGIPPFLNDLLSTINRHTRG